MHINPLLHRLKILKYPSNIQERLNITQPHDRSETLASRRHARQTSAHLAYTHEELCDGAVETFGEVVRLADEVVDEVHFEGETDEEEVAPCGVHVGFDVDLREVGLRR